MESDPVPRLDREGTGQEILEACSANHPRWPLAQQPPPVTSRY